MISSGGCESSVVRFLLIGDARRFWVPTLRGSWQRNGDFAMPAWLILIIIGVVLFVLGFTGIGHWLIWVGVIVLIGGAVLTLLGRSGGTRV